MDAILKAVEAADPLTPAQMERLGWWTDLPKAEAAALRKAMGIPRGIMCAPTIVHLCDIDTLQEVEREVKDVQIKPFANDDGGMVFITVYPAKCGTERTSFYVQSADNGGLTPAEVDEHMRM